MPLEPTISVGRDTSLPWHEAVALMGGIADGLSDGRMGRVPALHELVLDETGAPSCRPGATRSSGHDQRALALELRTLLGQMLDPAAPAPLRALADGTSQTVPGSIDEFREALRFFERPSRERDLQSLANRLREQQEERRVHSEMERLTQKARAEEPTPDTAAAASARAPRRAAWKSRVMLALGAATVLIVAAVLLFAATRARGNGSSSGPTPIRAAAGAVLTTLRQAARALAGSDVPAAVVDAPKPAPAPSPGRRRRKAVSPVRLAPVQPSASRPTATFLATGTEVVEVPVSRDLANDERPRSRATANVIYDRSSTEVIPAELLTPQSASVAPQVFIGGTGAMEILVGPDGRVERVRLVATTAERRYYDAMILSAAKSWVFRPANRQGMPVRYRLQIPLT